MSLKTFDYSEVNCLPSAMAASVRLAYADSCAAAVIVSGFCAALKSNQHAGLHRDASGRNACAGIQLTRRESSGRVFALRTARNRCADSRVPARNLVTELRKTHDSVGVSQR